MLKKDVVVGEVYVAKVSGRLVPVRIIRETHGFSGDHWEGRNEITGREVFIRGAQRLRRVFRPDLAR
jgi:hypothetical protein